MKRFLMFIAGIMGIISVTVGIAQLIAEKPPISIVNIAEGAAPAIRLMGLLQTAIAVPAIIAGAALIVASIVLLRQSETKKR